MRRRLPRRGEEGFTLVEVIVTVTIEAMIVTAIGAAFIGILNGSKNVNQSLARSSDARLAAAYFVSDAANSSGPEVSLSDTTSCPDPSPPVTGTATAVARFSWESTSSTGVDTANIANYVLVSNSLLRRQCKNGTLVVDKAVASNVQTAVASCSPNADCSGTPASINVIVTSVADSTGSVYTYTLSGTFRKLNGAGPTSPTNPQSIVTLGSGTNCSAGGTGISLTASASMTVYGDVFVNSVNAACKALSFTSNATYSAGGTNIITGGTCASTTGASPCPAYDTYTTALTDPYASLPVPSNGTARSGCSGGYASPGVYASTLTVSGTSCQLASGVYVLQNGLSVTGTSGGAASLTSASGGVLIYITGGSITTGTYGSNGGAINLQPMTTGSYEGVAIWQASADTTTMSISGSHSSLSLGGALYVPGAQVSISSGGDSEISSIVARTIWMASGNVVFGTPSATPLSITGPTSYAVSWTVNQPYPSATLTAAGGDGNYTWTVVGLPPGVSADPNTGVVSGTPTSTGSYSGTVTLSDLLGDTPLSGSYTLYVNAAPNITTSSLPAGDRTVAYSKTLAVSGGTSGYTWAATGLPAGLAIGASTGVISGTPTTTGTSTVNVTVTDAAGATDTQSISLTINSLPSITTSSLVSGEKSAPYTSAAASATGGTTAYAWSASGLPSGLSISSSTGVISGTPTASAGTYTVSLTVTDAAGGTASRSLSLVLAGQPTISSVTLTNKSGGTAGTIEQGDSFTIVYSAQMDVSDFCSAWTSDTSNQSLSADNDVTVTVNDSSSNDWITVSSATCTFNFGQITLGSGSYVSSTATFKGASSSKSTITWNASTHTLVVTLGAKTAGTTANVSSSTPVYTAPSTLSDTSNGTIGNSPYTLSTGKKF